MQLKTPLSRRIDQAGALVRRSNALAMGVATAILTFVLGASLIVLGATCQADRQRGQPVAETAPATTAVAEIPGPLAAPSPAAPSADAPPVSAESPVAPAATAALARPPINWAEVSRGELANRLTALPSGRWGDAVQRFAERASSPAAEAPRAPRYILSAIPSTALGFAWPVRGATSSTFSDDHPLGIDIAPADINAFVLASRDGLVVAAGGDPCCGYGYYVIMDHGDGLTSIYGHLRETPLVQVGERIERGTVLGVTGDTGNSHGIHLHFEVRLSGIPVDPELVLTAGELTPLPVRAVRAPDAQAADRAVGADLPEARDTPADEPGRQTGDRPNISDAMPPEERAAPAALPTAIPAPPATQTPSRSPTVGPPPAVASPVATPSPAPSARPASSGLPSPSTMMTETPTPVPTSTPLPTPTPSPTPSAGAQQAAPADATPPACVTVRLAPDASGKLSQRVTGGQSAFVTLEAEPGSVVSVTAERCGTAATARVTAVLPAERRCAATLYDGTGVRRRVLTVDSSAPADQPDPGTIRLRWTVGETDLLPGTVVRLICAEANSRVDD